MKKYFIVVVAFVASVVVQAQQVSTEQVATSHGLTASIQEVEYKSLAEKAKSVPVDLKEFLLAHGASWSTWFSAKNPVARAFFIDNMARVPYLDEGYLVSIQYLTLDNTLMTAYERLDPFGSNRPPTNRIVIARAEKGKKAKRIISLEIITLKSLRRFTLSNHLL